MTNCSWTVRSTSSGVGKTIAKWVGSASSARSCHAPSNSRSHWLKLLDNTTILECSHLVHRLGLVNHVSRRSPFWGSPPFWAMISTHFSHRSWTHVGWSAIPSGNSGRSSSCPPCVPTAWTYLINSSVRLKLSNRGLSSLPLLLWICFWSLTSTSLAIWGASRTHEAGFVNWIKLLLSDSSFASWVESAKIWTLMPRPYLVAVSWTPSPASGWTHCLLFRMNASNNGIRSARTRALHTLGTATAKDTTTLDSTSSTNSIENRTEFKSRGLCVSIMCAMCSSMPCLCVNGCTRSINTVLPGTRWYSQSSKRSSLHSAGSSPRMAILGSRRKLVVSWSMNQV